MKDLLSKYDYCAECARGVRPGGRVGCVVDASAERSELTSKVKNLSLSELKEIVRYLARTVPDQYLAEDVCAALDEQL